MRRNVTIRNDINYFDAASYELSVSLMTACATLDIWDTVTPSVGLSMDCRDGQQRIGMICLVRLSKIDAFV